MLESIAVALSVFAFAVLAALASDCARREPAGLPLSDRLPRVVAGRPLRVLWLAALGLSFVAGLYGLTVVEHRDVREGRAGGAPGTEVRRILRLPFYVREDRVATAVDGSFQGSSHTTRVQLPWAFLAVAGLYVWGVSPPSGGRAGPR